MNIYKHIEKTTDVEYLKKLLEYVDIDISNIGQNRKIVSIQLNDSNTTVGEYEQRQLNGLTDLKNKIENRIKNLE